MPERWGIKGDGWAEIRIIPLGEETARGWCVSLSTSGRRREPMALFRDIGDGWQVVQRYPLERGTDQ
jgi:hypothetical protein